MTEKEDVKRKKDRKKEGIGGEKKEKQILTQQYQI